MAALNTPEEEQQDGPRYKMCTFLFGNVDKQGRLEEEYAKSEELSSINNLEKCHIAEVTATVRAIVADTGEQSSEPIAVLETKFTESNFEPCDYYDETELIIEPEVDLKAMENLLPSRNDDEDDYDQPLSPSKIKTADANPASVFTSVVSVSEIGVLTTTPGSCLLPDSRLSHTPLLNSLSETQPSLTISPLTHGDVLESTSVAFDEISIKPEESSLPILKNAETGLPANVSERNSTNDALKTSTSIEKEIEHESSEPTTVAFDSTSSMMPPPLHPAPVAVSKCVPQQKNALPVGHPSSPVRRSALSSPRGSAGFDSYSPTSYGACASSPSLNIVGFETESTLITTKPFGYPTTLSSEFLNTPLGNLLPPEYAGVDITTLFPHYSPTATPRWSRLFRLTYPLRLYHGLKRSNKRTNISERHSNFDDRLHLIFRDFLDLGELPYLEKEFEEARLLDEVDELEKPPLPYEAGLDFLAGASNSWWRRAYSEKLFELDQELHKLQNSKEPKAATLKKSTSGPRSAENIKNHFLMETDNTTVSKFCTWRFGPAKYWYDQMEIPEAADIQKWSSWNRSQPNVFPANVGQSSCQAVNSDNHIQLPKHLTGPDGLGHHGAALFEGCPDSIAAASESSVICEKDKGGIVIKNEERGAVLSKQEYQNESFAVLNKHKELSPPRLSSDAVFLPYQLLQWEDDIIYDAQLSATKVSMSARQNAAFAGWIPSQHCRTMAAFQDAYQGKYPGILGYKALTGFGGGDRSASVSVPSVLRGPASVGITGEVSSLRSALTVGGGLQNLTSGSSVGAIGASSASPYAFFPVENAAILSDSWRWDIIYDCDVSESSQPPFLLTLDANDENCILVDTIVNDDEIAVTTRGRSTTTWDDANGESLEGSSSEQQQQKSSASGGGGGGAINRASFHVSFGLASTRGMLTGALAKAAQGAEKVKRILGKHGLLAEGDWHSDGEDDVTVGASTETEVEAANNMASVAAAASGLPPKDPLNLSNDEFYAIRSGGLFGCLARCGPLQHSTPAVELWPPFFPTFSTPLWLRQFHRVPLKRYGRGNMSQYNVPISVVNLTKNIQKKLKEREEEKAAAGGGDIFFMRTPADLTGCDGDIVIFEFSEEYPPLMMQTGMATRLVNYFRPLQPRDPTLSPDPAARNSPPEYQYGALVYVGSTDSPFLGVIRPGGCLQSLENNMYRAPVYSHKMPQTDFLVIRNRNGLWIRRVPTAFTVGQEVPLMEVPGPNSKRANNFARDFLQVYILRLFLRSTDEPKRIKMEEIRNAFPNHSESSVRKRLKICADFKRTGTDASWWVLRQDYRLPSEEEIRYLVQPEDVCAFLSMQAAELRLKDAGYGEKSLFVLDENQEEEEEKKEGQIKLPSNLLQVFLSGYLSSYSTSQRCVEGVLLWQMNLQILEPFQTGKTSLILSVDQITQPGRPPLHNGPKMEDEVRAAPWNTTRAYLAAQRGGCFLELHGPADPTGCGEAFSYSKTSAKPGALFRQAGGEAARGLLKDKRTVTGTDADLRKLHLREARALLRSFGISEGDLKTLKRWEIIDMVRFTSTERAKQGEEESTAKFARGNRLSMSEQIRCYREECQRIFDLQNRVLSNTELLSSDEGEDEPSSEEEEEETEFLGPGGTRVSGGVTGSAHSAGGSSSNAIAGVRLSSLPSNRSSYETASRNIESMLANRITSEELKQRQEEADCEDLKRSIELGRSLGSSKRNRKPMHPTGDFGTALVSEDSVLPSVPPAAVVYDANSTSAGEILDLAPPFSSAQKKVLRIVRTYSTGGQQYTRTELVPWSPVVEIYLKIRQTRDNEFIHQFIGSDDQFREQQRKEKRRLQDQLRRVRKQQDLMRSRTGAAIRDANGRLIASPNRAGVVSRRRHKPSNLVLKMRCGACGQTGHMRTNKECPMYGRSDAITGSVAGGISSATERRPVNGGQSRSNATGGRYSTDLGGNEPETVSAALELISKPVAELLANPMWSLNSTTAVDAEEAAGAGELGPGSLLSDTGANAGGGEGSQRGGGNLSDDSNPGDMPDDEFPELGENATTIVGTKLKLHPNLMRYIEAKKRRDLKLTINRPLLEELDKASKVVAEADAAANLRRLVATQPHRTGGGVSSLCSRRRGSTTATAADDDYPTSTVKNRGNRRRIDPRVAINHIFEGIYKSLSQVPGYKIFMYPVKEKDFPNYYSEIENPMDLSQIRMKINNNAFSTREEFLADIRLIHDNSRKFNGPHSAYTETAKKMCSLVMEEFCQKETKLMRLESLVNPLLDEDDLVSLSFLLQKAVEAMRSVENSRAFHFPVDKRRYPNYYKTIEHPMDLATLERQVKDHRYHSRDDFFADSDLILSNCIKFNGQESVLTKIAQKMLAAARSRLEDDAETLEIIEEGIRQRLDDVSIVDSMSHQGPSRASETTLRRRQPTATTGEEPSDSKQRRISSTSNLFVGNQPPQSQLDIGIADSGDRSRSSRQATAGAWYGADLYSDDEDSGQTNRRHRVSKRPAPEMDDYDDDEEDRLTSVSEMSQRKRTKVNMTEILEEVTDADFNLTSPEVFATTSPGLPLSSRDLLDEEVSRQSLEASRLTAIDYPHGSEFDNVRGLYLPGSSVFTDEDTRLSCDAGNGSAYGKDPPETSVAQDLQLTDSECSDSLSEQGGELCAETNNETNADQPEGSAFTPDLDSEQANDGFGSPSYQERPQSRVEFFIGSDDDDDDSQPTDVFS